MNKYGLAQTEFQLGYICTTYSKVLLTDLQDEQLNRQKKRLQIPSTSETFKKKMIDHFQLAFDYFKEFNHLKGMYLAKKNIHTILTDHNDDSAKKVKEEII